ncbi:MAG: helix-turn-helix transcriptional regulator [candidate division Zixibacteria bacterium]|nr:helix-turn-helix transcriptional regulator [candidate division Zixibacteria bacterium]
MANLTPREIEVAERLARGESTKEVARSLQCTARTVNAHVEHIKAKLGAKNRAHIIVKAIQAGEITLKALIFAFIVFTSDDDMRRGQRSRVRNQSQSGRASSRYEIHM